MEGPEVEGDGPAWPRLLCSKVLSLLRGTSKKSPPVAGCWGEDEEDKSSSESGDSSAKDGEATSSCKTGGAEGLG